MCLPFTNNYSACVHDNVTTEGRVENNKFASCIRQMLDDIDFGKALHRWWQLKELTQWQKTPIPILVVLSLLQLHEVAATEGDMQPMQKDYDGV